MSEELRDCRLGRPVGAWIEEWVEECDRDPVGLFGVVDSGRKAFRLHGADLESFVRRALLAMMHAGARPVLGSRDGPKSWVLQPQYGTAPDVIVDAAMREWRESGRDPEFTDIWFATPRVYDEADD